MAGGGERRLGEGKEGWGSGKETGGGEKGGKYGSLVMMNLKGSIIGLLFHLLSCFLVYIYLFIYLLVLVFPSDLLALVFLSLVFPSKFSV